MNLRDFSSAPFRRNVLEKELGVRLEHIGKLDEEARIENRIGATHVPLGIAGPINGKYIPLATTEGALVASVSRGCKAITESGGATVDSYRVGTTRGPVFKVNNLSESDKLNAFLDKHLTQLRHIAKETSHHLTLTKYMDRGVGKYRYVRFVFDTKDAMGMNMVTIATQKLVEFIESKTSARCISLAGNYDVDKKSSWLNAIEGRGIKVWAEVTIPAIVLEKTLKTNAQKMYEVWLAKCMIGSAMSGSMGFNAQYANIVAAIFIATGQDPAHVVEGSLGITTTEVVDNGNLYVSIFMPDLMVGIVGGGTGLRTQKEALSIIGVKSSEEFAEVVGAAVLAGELSLLASLSEGTLAQAHNRLGRGHK